jgi:dTDP-4-amino-4,6-dideoxygalactose transaminase
MNVPFVDLKAQYASLKPQMDATIQSVLDRSAFILGPEVEAFEQAFADYIGVKHAIGVGSGTDALRLALEALNIGPGDEVITVANTYIATCEAITHVGATVRLVDADPRTYNMDVGKLVETVETLIKGPRTADCRPPLGSQRSVASGRLRAIIPVHLYGQPADMGPIMEIAHKYGLKVIEDCAQAHGAQITNPQSAIRNPKSWKVGSFGDVACFSFYPGKNLGAYGDAGAVLTNDDNIAERVRMLRNHGQKVKYEHLVVGYCHRLDNLQAAVLNVKLPYLDGWNAARRSRAALYDQLLQDVPGIVTPYVLPHVEPVYHLYVIRVTDGRRDALQRYLNDAGIATGLHYPIPVHLQQAYASLGHKPGDFPVSEQLAVQGLSLPMYPELSDEQVHYVAAKIREFMTHGR